MIVFESNFKYRLREYWQYQLKEDYGLEPESGWQHPEGWYGYYWCFVKKCFYIYANAGCGWNGADCFPDFGWIMEGSLGHDLLLWLIAKGKIHPAYNDTVDKEIRHIINERAPRPPLMGDRGLNRLARIVMRGTNLANTKLNDLNPIYEISRERGKVRIR